MMQDKDSTGLEALMAAQRAAYRDPLFTQEAEDRVKQAFRADSPAQMAEDRVKRAFRE